MHRPTTDPVIQSAAKNTVINMSQLAKLIEPETLLEELENPKLLIIDLCNDQLYSRKHIPGAIHISPREIVCGIPPATGKLPSEEQLSALFSRIGLTEDRHVVAYDDEGGGWAGRFIWTLEVIGHRNWSYLNGGFVAWHNEGFPLQREIPFSQAVEKSVSIQRDIVTETEEIISNLADDSYQIWDARSYPEYTGERVIANRGGHIPGAIHCEWTTLMDSQRNLRIREDAANYLASLGIDSSKTVTTYCQTHHRSGFTWLVARLLGFRDVRAYHGAWSEWGNRTDTPTET